MDHEMHHDMMMMEPDGGELADALAGEVNAAAVESFDDDEPRCVAHTWGACATGELGERFLAKG